MTLDETTRTTAQPDGEGDEDLVAEAARGSGAALAALYERHKDAVYRLAYRVVGNRHDAEDVLQDVFVGLERALARYEERGRFRSWLLKVTARTAQLHVRRREPPGRAAEGRSTAGSAPWGERAPSGPAAGNAAAHAASGDLAVERVAVREALARMPEEQRVVFLLKEVEGYRHEEIARLLGISAGSSRVRLHRAWRFLEREVRA